MSHDENGALRERLRADRPQAVSRWARYGLTKDSALAEFRRYLELFPGAAPEVIAFEMIRYVDDWDEVSAIRAALHEILSARDEAGR